LHYQKIKRKNNMSEMKQPKYNWVEEEGVDDVTPIRRKISKTMEITESFTFYDTLAYVMKMEKAVEDKQKEIEGLQSMIKAYRDEIELIEKELNVTEIEETWNKELHEKLKKEAEEKVEEESKE